MCDAEATTREHVPPKSFFPDGYRKDLITVPSCPAHNHAQSLDIEYARNIVAGFDGVNQVGELVFELAKRSYNRSPALFCESFHDFRPICINGQDTGAFTVDLERVKSKMAPIANAIYFKEYGHQYPAQWNVFLASMRSQDADGRLIAESSRWQKVRKLVATIQFVPKLVPQPNVFGFGVCELPGGLMFEFVFYGGFTIHCFGPMIEKNLAA